MGSETWMTECKLCKTDVPEGKEYCENVLKTIE